MNRLIETTPPARKAAATVCPPISGRERGAGPITAYYNEIDPYAAQWLRNLIAAGHIAPGVVDERSIVDVDPAELAQYTQCHFFAGIGGWAYALRLAGWPDNRPVWTGSCPCQPFSVAGARKGTDDERHLWPAFRWLIAQRRPATVFGEQVASDDGRQWLAGVRADLEALDYVVGAADLCAAGAGAPHIRQRLWWMAHATGARPKPARQGTETEARHEARLRGLERGRPSGNGGLGNTDNAGPQGRRIDSGEHADQLFAVAASVPGFWSAHDAIPCTDGKSRRVEPGTFPLAHGVPARVGKLRAYGNAIVPQIAKVFIEACDLSAAELAGSAQ